MYLEKSDLPQQLRHLVPPGLIRLEPCEQMTIPADAGIWSGGTRQLFSAIELSTGKAVSITDTFSAPWDAGRTSKSIKLKPGYAIVELGSFCGKSAGLKIYALPGDLAPLLPAPAELERVEWEVLDVICGLKSGYRAEEYARRKLPDVVVTQAKLSLQSRGMLDSRGAVTVKGRNARQTCKTTPQI